MYFPSFGGVGKITDIESVGDGFIRFKNGYQICWGLELWDQMNRPSGGGDDLDNGILHDSGAQNTSFGSDTEAETRNKTITFPVPFTITPYIVISPGSSNFSSQTSIPAAWYHNALTTGFTAELYAAVKLTWIAIGKWK